MPTWTPPVTLTANTNENVNDLNAIITSLQAIVNGLDDANISATAAIQESKLATGVNGMARGAFYAFRNAVQSIPTGLVTPTVVNFNAELFDVSGWHDTVTNIGRYTPQVPGYYRFSWNVKASGAPAAATAWKTVLRKNAADYADGVVGYQTGAAEAVSSGGSASAQANGTTDFFEVAILHNEGVARNIAAQANWVYFTGELIGRS